MQPKAVSVMFITKNRSMHRLKQRVISAMHSMITVKKYKKKLLLGKLYINRY